MKFRLAGSVVCACLSAALIGCSEATPKAPAAPFALAAGGVKSNVAAAVPHVRRPSEEIVCSNGPGKYSFVGAGNNTAGGDSSVAVGGTANEACGVQGVIVGGDSNGSTGESSFIGSGFSNTLAGDFGTIGGGYANENDSGYGVIGGGQDNVLSSGQSYGVIAGGDNNTSSGVDAVISGGHFSHNSGSYGVVGGGWNNTIFAPASYGVIGGGWTNTITAPYTTIAGGYGATIEAQYGFVGGGQSNYISSTAADGFIGGGSNNAVSALYGVIAGGLNNTVSGEGGYIAAGGYNTLSGIGAVIDGGFNNTAGGAYGTVPGGYVNSAGGTYSFAAGARASAAQNGTFVWSDGSDGDAILTSARAYQFLARASGGFTLWTNAASTVGATLAPGSGTWASVSDRNMKTDVVRVDDAAVLDKVASLPINRWSYITERAVRHVGPMAQDFYAAFGVGEDDKHITSIDEDGVALAAIKALHAENVRLRRELAILGTAEARHDAHDRRVDAALARLGLRSL